MSFTNYCRTLNFFLSVCLLVTVTGVLQALGADKVKLEYRYPPEREFEYHMTVDSRSTFSIFGMERKFTELEQVSFGVKGIPSTEKDILRLLLSVKKGEKTSEGKVTPHEMVGKGVELLLKKSGTVISSSEPGILTNFQDTLITFPERELGPGDTWTNAVPLAPEPDGKPREILYKISEFKEFKGRKCAVVEYSLEVKESGEKTDILVSFMGKLHFDYTEGIIVANQSQIAMDVTMKEKNNKTGRIEPLSTVTTVMNTGILLQENTK